MLKTFVAISASVSLASAAIAQERKNCVSEAEAAAIFATMMPDMIGGLRDKCKAHLPADSFLMSNADALISRYKPLADQRWPAAKLAFGKIAGAEEMTRNMPDQFLRPLIGSTVGAELFKNAEPSDCTGASKILQSLAPLPPENVSNLIGAMLTLVDHKPGSKMPVCKV